LDYFPSQGIGIVLRDRFFNLMRRRSFWKWRSQF